MRVEISLSFPKDKKTMAKEAKAIADKAVKNIGLPQIWTVTRNNGNNTFDLIRGGVRRRAIYAMDPLAYQFIFPPMSVLCVYEYMRKDRMKIVGVFGFGQEDSSIIRLAIWGQEEGGPGLRYSTISPPVFQHGFNTYWTGASRFSANPLGVVIDGLSNVITAQPYRALDDSAWETLRLSIISPEALVPSEFNCAISNGSGDFESANGIWTNYDSSLVVLVDSSLNQIFRKRGILFEQVILAGVGSRNLLGMNLSTIGGILMPQTTPLWPDYSVDSGEAVTVTSQDNSGLDSISYWRADIAGVSIPNSWNLPYDLIHPSGIKYKRDPVRAPYLPAAGAFLLFSSSRDLIPFSTNANRSLLRGYDPVPTIVHGLETRISRNLRAAVTAVSESGAVKWIHEITHAATSALFDNGLLGALTAWFTANVGVIGAAGNTCDGVYSENEITSDSANTGSGFADVYYGPYGDTGNTFQIPQYDYFKSVSIVGLPLDSPNNQMPEDILGSLRNTKTFTEYGKDTSAEGLTVKAKLCTDLEENSYLSYLKPIPFLLSGRVTYDPGGGTFTSLGAGTSVISIIERLGGGSFRGNHVPEIDYYWKRYIRKISNTGGLLAEVEIEQNLTASWYEAEDALGSPTGTPLAIGGDSVGELSLGDNTWVMRSIGRLLFAIMDFHDLGPNFLPATKLLVFDTVTLAILHTIELRLTEDLIPSDILDGGSNIVFYAGEREYSVIGASCGVKGSVSEAGLENVLVWVNQEQRTSDTPTQIGQRLAILQFSEDVNTPPSVSFEYNDAQLVGSAIANGFLFDLKYDTAWKIRQMV